VSVVGDSDVRKAMALPGFRWMPGMRGYGLLKIPFRLVTADETGDDDPTTPENIDSSVCVLDPDDAATAGCLLGLLGDEASLLQHDGVHWADINLERYDTLGRACIAAALALGFWPGGD